MMRQPKSIDSWRMFVGELNVKKISSATESLEGEEKSINQTHVNKRNEEIRTYSELDSVEVLTNQTLELLPITLSGV